MLFKVGIILLPLILCSLYLGVTFKKPWPSYLLMGVTFFGTTYALINYQFFSGPNAITGDPIMLSAVVQHHIKMASVRGAIFIPVAITLVAHLRKKRSKPEDR